MAICCPILFRKAIVVLIFENSVEEPNIGFKTFFFLTSIHFVDYIVVFSSTFDHGSSVCQFHPFTT